MGLKDNKCELRNRETIFEKLPEEKKTRIRQLIHEEFRKFKKTPGQPIPDDARYPTIESLHDKIQKTGEFEVWSVSTTRLVFLIFQNSS